MVSDPHKRRLGVQPTAQMGRNNQCICRVLCVTANSEARCPLYPQKRTLIAATGMSALCHKRTLMGFAVRWRNVFDRNYVAFQALLDLCHSALWLVCRCLPCVFERYFGSPC